MSLKIISLHGQGKADKEYVFIEVLEDCNTEQFLLLDRTYDEEGFQSNRSRHVFLFPDKDVKKGEYISVRTRKGKDHEGKADNGKPVHRFHWGLGEAVWNDTGDTAFLLRWKLVSKMASA